MRLLLLLSSFLLVTSLAHAQELTLRHALQGPALNSLGALVVKFNDEQKGKGRIRLQSLPPDEERHPLPQLALLDRADSMQFFGTLPRFMPLHELMKSGGQKLDERSLFPQVADAIDDGAGRLQALPMALSLPVLFLNRDILRGAGVDPTTPPRTWWELQGVAGKIYDSGNMCPLTSSEFSWVHLENLASQHDQPIGVRSKNSEKLLLNSMVNVKHIALLASWQKSRYFHYYGARREGDERFLSGECAMLTGESSLYAETRRRGMDVAVVGLPHYDDAYRPSPTDVLPDGASLWALAGMKKDEVKLAAKFMSFLLRPEVQRDWAHATTFLPMTPAAVQAWREAKIFPEALLDAAQRRLAMPTKNSTRLRTGAMRERLRAILGEEIQPVWSSGRPAKEALDLAMQRANALGAPVVAPTPKLR
jgi:sn-glycerol 3-phosphate transport system substrate-binding protein